MSEQITKNQSEQQPITKQFYKKWWFWLVIVILVLSAIFGTSDTDTEDEEEIETTASITSTATTTKKLSKEETIRNQIIDVVDEDNLETFNYVPDNNFTLIKFKGSENLTNNMIINGMYSDIFDILKSIQSDIDTDVDFNVVYPLQDKYGNKSDVIVIKATFKKGTIKKIKFENISYESIPDIADEWWNHRALEVE